MTVTGNPVPGLQYDRGRRSRRRPPKKSRVFRRLLTALVVVAALVGGGIWGAGKLIGSIRPATSGGGGDYAGAGTGQTFVHIVPGSSARAIGDTLVKDGVVKSSDAFVEAANAGDSTQSLQPGYYTMRKQMSAASALTLLLDPNSKSRSQVIVPEGITTRDVAVLLSGKTRLSATDLSHAVVPPGNAALGLPSWSGGNTEGFLYPGTYDLPPGAAAATLLKPMVSAFDEEATKLDLTQGAAALGRTPLQILTVASIIEKEVKNPDERAKVARVIYNRLADRTGKYRTLGLDSTTRYALGEYMGPLTTAQLNVRSPYNTRVVPGLPPGPIGNPGEAALQAALHPATGTWLYFVTLPKEQETIFATTEAEWNRDYKRYLSEVRAGG